MAYRTSWTRYVQREIALFKVWQAAGSLGVTRRTVAWPLVAFSLEEHLHGLRRRLGLPHARRGTPEPV